MARVVATKGNRLTKKPEIAIEDNIRRLIKSLIEFHLTQKEFKKLNLAVQQKSEVLNNVLDGFGDAIFTQVDCAVANELSLIGDDDDDNGQGDAETDYDRY